MVGVPGARCKLNKNIIDDHSVTHNLNISLRENVIVFYTTLMKTS
jgi:hypothetical protein